MRARQGGTTVLVEVGRKVRRDRLLAWVGFARSQSNDTRVLVATDKLPSSTDQEFLRNEGVGLIEVRDSRTHFIIQPKDVALHLSRPDLANYPVRIRRLLNGAYQKINDSYWKEGFEDACVTLESETRRYLIRHINSGRIIVLDSHGKPKSYTAQQINRMPMGALAELFPRFQRANRADSLIGDALSRINKDRISVAHRKGGQRAEQRLRKNVSQHMWVIVDALKEAIR